MGRSAASCAAALGRARAGCGFRRFSFLRLLGGPGLFRPRLGPGILAFALGFGEPFLEALEEAAQAVDRGGAECLGNAVALDLDPGAALEPAGDPLADFANHRAGAGPDRLLRLLADLLGQLHSGDFLGYLDGPGHDLSPRVL